MVRLFYIFIFPCLLITSSNATGQSVVFEQQALDYFAEKMVGKLDPFKDFVIHFSGKVDSTITTIEYEMTQFYPSDTLLKSEYKKVSKATNDFWRKNKKPSFYLQIKDPVKAIEKRKYSKKSNAIRLIIYQNKRVGERYYVQFRGFTRTGSTGYDIYFIMNSSGEVIKWYHASFIF